MRRDGAPRAEPGVIDTFLAVLPVAQDPVRDGIALFSVFPLALGNGLLRAFPIQLHNATVFHVSHLRVIMCLHSYTPKKGWIGY